MSVNRVFADTNVFAYALDAADATKQRQAQHILAAHGARLDVVPADRSLMLDAAALAAERGVSVFDAAIACAAIRAECELLLSEDFALVGAIDGLHVIDPFT